VLICASRKTSAHGLLHQTRLLRAFQLSERHVHITTFDRQEYTLVPVYTQQGASPRSRMAAAATSQATPPSAQGWSTTLMQKLYKERPRFCDVAIECTATNDSVYAHRAVLAARTQCAPTLGRPLRQALEAEVYLYISSRI
jgi:BTB/POZ domain